jgi:hypothetical protein
VVWERNAVTVRGTLAATVVVVAIIGNSGQALAARVIHADPGRYWGVTYLGDWHVQAEPGFPFAVSALDRPSRIVNPERASCRATWRRLGIRINLRTSAGAAAATTALHRAHRSRASGDAGLGAPRRDFGSETA